MDESFNQPTPAERRYCPYCGPPFSAPEIPNPKHSIGSRCSGLRPPIVCTHRSSAPAPGAFPGVSPSRIVPSRCSDSEIASLRSPLVAFVTDLAGAPKTVGVLERVRAATLPSFAAVETARMQAAQAAGVAAGKIVAFTPYHNTADVGVYQVDDTGRVTPALCGNAVVAAVRHLAAQGIHIAHVEVPHRQRHSLAILEPVDDEISWTLYGDCTPRRTRVGRFDAAIVEGLNTYLLISAHPNEVAADRVHAIIRDPEIDRVAVVEPRPETPATAFYGPRRLHPSAPMTGQAALVVAAYFLPSFAGLHGGAAIRVESGVETLPNVRVKRGAIQLSLPPRGVTFS